MIFWSVMLFVNLVLMFVNFASENGSPFFAVVTGIMAILSLVSLFREKD